MSLKFNSISEQLELSAIDFNTLRNNYHPMLELVRELIGVVPNCDKLLEIWSTGFRTYNLLVPNFLNLPFSLFGFSSPKKLMGLAMYASSKAAECYYCSAHTCAFALRRGVNPISLVDSRDPKEIAVLEVAEALSQIPCSLSTKQCQTLVKYLSPTDVEWIILAIGMMGFLNKFMDAVGVELEAEVVSEAELFLKFSGGYDRQNTQKDTDEIFDMLTSNIDSLKTYVRVLRLVPSALSLEKTWTRRVPDRYSEAKVFLEQHTGYSFPLLGKLKHKRAIRALTTILKDNLNPQNSELGITIKCLAGLVYAHIVGDSVLVEEACLLLAHFAPEIDRKTLATIIEFASQPDLENVADIERESIRLSSLPNFSDQTVAALLLAKAASSSPAKINSHVLERADRCLNSASIIELMVWLSIQQLLHRINCFYQIMNSV